jgi:nucleotidyltransferase/DNA polymerase involved in DNA repair
MGDGDRIRESVDRLFFAGDISGLRSFSSSLSQAVADIRDSAARELGADIVVAGGDDILFSCSAEAISREFLARLDDGFRQATGCTISFGLGSTLESAYLALRRAKSQGGSTIVDPTHLLANS